MFKKLAFKKLALVMSIVYGLVAGIPALAQSIVNQRALSLNRSRRQRGLRRGDRLQEPLGHCHCLHHRHGHVPARTRQTRLRNVMVGSSPKIVVTV